MEPTAIAAMMVAGTQAKIASAVAAKMARINADAAQQMVQMVQDSADNLEAIATNLPSGVGQNVNKSA